MIPELRGSPGEGIGYPFQYSCTSLVAQTVKNLPVMWGTWVQSLAREDPLEESMAIHFSILAWGITMDRAAWRATCRVHHVKMPGWMKHKLESRLPGEISITSNSHMTPP